MMSTRQDLISPGQLSLLDLLHSDHPQQDQIVSSKLLEKSSKLNSCLAITKGRIEGIISYDVRQWICLGSCHKGGKTLSANLFEVVPSSQISIPRKERKYENSIPTEPMSYQGVMGTFRGKSFIITGHQIKIRGSAQDIPAGHGKDE